MNLSAHVAASTVVGACAYAVTKSPEYSIAAALSGILIDVDHIFEYWLDNGINFNMKKFFRYSGTESFTRYMLLFHSLEFLFLLLLFAAFKGFGSIYAALAIGIGVHLVLDYINIVTRLGFKPKAAVLFLLSYRARYGFERFPSLS